MELITLIILCIVLVFVYLITRFNYWKNLNVLQFETTFPEGNAKGLSKKFHSSKLISDIYKKAKDQGAKFCGIYIYFKPIFFAVDLDIIKAILVKDFNVFPNRGIFFSKYDPLSAHMFNIENEPWRILRHKLSPTFTTGKIKMMFSTVDNVASTLIKKIDRQVAADPCVEIKDMLARFTTDVIGSVAFGLECSSLEDPNSKFYEMGSRIFSTPVRFYHRMIRNSFRELATVLRMKAIPEEISNFYLQVTRDTVEYREKNPHVKRQDFMNLLVEMKKEGMLTVEQIAAQSFVFFLAGYETTSSTMTYCMYELSIKQEIQDKARKSVREVLKKYDNKLSYDSVNDMEYLEQCVDETLRKYPVVTTLLRTSVRDYQVPGTKIVLPKGQSVWIPVYSIHHDPDIYPQPEVFDPDRFSPDKVANRHPMAHIPFGEGQRICIGMRFGIVETKLGLARLLMNYRFSLDRSKTPVPLNISPNVLVLTPKEKIFLKLEKL